MTPSTDISYPLLFSSEYRKELESAGMLVQPASTSIKDDQKAISEQLVVLRQVQHYTNLYFPKIPRNHGTDRDLRLLDTIAVALSTGNPGDVYAAAFDKRGQVHLVLAKNSLPRPDDIAAANELISLITNPEVRNASHLFPYLMRRCGANMDKRIRSLNALMTSKRLQSSISYWMATYEPQVDMLVEFPGAGKLLKKYGDSMPPFSDIWGDCTKEITDLTAHGLDPDNLPLSRLRYDRISLIATTLERSLFLNDALTNTMGAKLQRRLHKIRQYTRDVTHLINHAKRIFPIPYHWVTDTYSGTTGESTFDLCDDINDVISRTHSPPLPPKDKTKLTKRVPSIAQDWEKHRAVDARIHAELRIIFHLGPPDASDESSGPLQPIGLSQQTCWSCSAWIYKHNWMFRTRWLTSTLQGKPRENWAIPGSACPYVIQTEVGSVLDDAVMGAVRGVTENGLVGAAMTSGISYSVLVRHGSYLVEL